jgi:hypothetical protein
MENDSLETTEKNQFEPDSLPSKFTSTSIHEIGQPIKRHYSLDPFNGPRLSYVGSPATYRPITRVSVPPFRVTHSTRTWQSKAFIDILKSVQRTCRLTPEHIDGLPKVGM